MKSLKKYASALSAGAASFGAMALAFVASAQATTLDDVVEEGVTAITTGYTDSLIANLPTVITAVISIGLVFVLIKLAMRWVKSSVH